MKNKNFLYVLFGVASFLLLVCGVLYLIGGIAYAVAGFLFLLGAGLIFAFGVSFVIHKLDLAEREEEERNRIF
jgi:hypothetical protein